MSLDVHTYASPIGPLGLAARGDQLVVLHLPASSDPSPTGSERMTPILARTIGQLDEYFAGTRTEFDLDLAPDGTEFQRAVWNALLEVPYGATCSYGAIASAISRPSASRAVGAANGRNPIAIIIPCHRVIGSSGTLTGYGGGLPTKQFLLQLERGQPSPRLVPEHAVQLRWQWS
jgi:methylated-DNA-[protein]-cysteine S-methyltransferase